VLGYWRWRSISLSSARCGLDLVACAFFFSSRRRHTILVSDWSSDVCSSDLPASAFRTRQEAKTIAPRIPGRFVNPAKLWRWFAQIGRASCRERVEISEGAVLFEKRQRTCGVRRTSQSERRRAIAISDGATDG